MIQLNWIAILVAALVPLALGMVWYNPKFLGTSWMKASGMTEEKAKSANMPLIMGLTLLFSIMMSFVIQFMVIHQFHVFSTLQGQPEINDPNSELSLWLKGFMAEHGNNFRTFKHGMLHGFIGGLFLALPITAINAMFERRGFKYIAINAGYWIISIMLMGGILSAWQ